MSKKALSLLLLMSVVGQSVQAGCGDCVKSVGRFGRDIANITLRPKWVTDTKEASQDPDNGDLIEGKVVDKPTEEVLALLISKSINGVICYYNKEGDSGNRKKYPFLIQDATGVFFDCNEDNNVLVRPGEGDKKSKMIYIKSRKEKIY